MTKCLTGLLVLCAVAAALAQTGSSLIWKPVAPYAEELTFVAPSATARISDTPRVLSSGIRDDKKFKNSIVSPRVVIDNPYLDPADPFFNIPRAMACTADGGLVVASTAKTSPSGRFAGTPFASGFWRIAPDGAITALTAKHIVVERTPTLPICDAPFAKSRLTPEIELMTVTADGGFLFAAEGVILKLTAAGRVELVPPSPMGCAPPGLSRDALARFKEPRTAVEDPRGAIWVADECRLTRVDPDGSATTILDKSIVCPAGDPEHTLRMDDMLWDTAKDELVTSGTHYFDGAPKTNFYSMVWRISRDGRARRVYRGVRLGRAPVGTRVDGISGLALDGQGRIHFGAVINEGSGSEIRRLDEATGVATVVAGISRPTDVSYGDGAVKQAYFGTIRGLCFAPNGTLFVHDASLVIRKVTRAGQVTTWAF
jgi:hypothetical protein